MKASLRSDAVRNLDVFKGSAEEILALDGIFKAEGRNDDSLSIEKTPPTFDPTVDIIFPFLITEFKKEISNVMGVGLAYECVQESLDEESSGGCNPQLKTRFT